VDCGTGTIPAGVRGPGAALRSGQSPRNGKTAAVAARQGPMTEGAAVARGGKGGGERQDLSGQVGRGVIPRALGPLVRRNRKRKTGAIRQKRWWIIDGFLVLG